jgi:hypothetical protein
MRGLLIVLCSLATMAALLAGGCAFLFTGVAAAVAPNKDDLAGMLAITVPVLLVAAVVVGVNIALVAAIRNNRAPRRSGWFVMLAAIDILAACGMFAAAAAGGVPVLESLLLPAALLAKGLLTLLLPAEPPQLPPPSSSG